MTFDVRMPPPFSVNSLAKRWECSPSMIRKLIRQGRLAHFRIGELIRISQATVEAYENAAAVTTAAIEHVADANGNLDPTGAETSPFIRQIARAKRRTKPIRPQF